jgi:hypothetical protein
MDPELSINDTSPKPVAGDSLHSFAFLRWRGVEKLRSLLSRTGLMEFLDRVNVRGKAGHVK